MITTDRRLFWQSAIALALSPTIVVRTAHASDAGRLIAPPKTPMLYRREITRNLVGGAQITARRDFSITFASFPEGYIVDGAQTAVEIAVPSSLASFAQLEKSRAPKVFPIALDPFGQIRGVPAHIATDEAVSRAIDEADHKLATYPMTEGERGELVRFLESIHRAGEAITAEMPADLFAPRKAEDLVERHLNLPDGKLGKFTARYTSMRDETTGLMRHAERDIVTQIGSEQRITREKWTLSA